MRPIDGFLSHVHRSLSRKARKADIVGRDTYETLKETKHSKAPGVAPTKAMKMAATIARSDEERDQEKAPVMAAEAVEEDLDTKMEPATQPARRSSRPGKAPRKGLDLATTLERINKNFVITDPRLPDNPIIFASDNFLELTEYSREEILGKNCSGFQFPAFHCTDELRSGFLFRKKNFVDGLCASPLPYYLQSDFASTAYLPHLKGDALDT
ncbi:hypothetical protein CBR_g44331 [Chara braunii]|uniref:PAS domain-containing protein n=1 Tax=Chara braunii TaxID=69332 RepID=A0A388K344_CHABU|nr:hypothetical protein CBR_g44331 [Chara braunii]|eukprot:GBG64445.1 hypothetical protein CBR_g44331 [Chara braunii]